MMVDPVAPSTRSPRTESFPPRRAPLEHDEHSRRKWLLRSILVAFALFVAGEVGRLTSVMSTASPSPVTVFWPPSGIALGFALLFGLRIAPAILLGTLLEMVLYTPHLGKLVTYTLADSLTAIGTAWVLERYFDFDRRLGRVRDVVALFVIGAVVAPIPQSLIEIVAFLRIELPEEGLRNLVPYTFEGWLQNAMSVLVFTPVMLALRYAELRMLPFVRRAEGISLALIVFAITYFAHRNPSGTWMYGHLVAVAVFPFVITMVFRFGKAGAVVASLACAIGSIVAKSGWQGQLDDELLNFSIIDQSAFLTLVAVAGLLLAVMLVRRIASELQLATTEKSFQSLFEHSPIGIAIEREGAVRFVNSALRQLLTRDRDEDLIGRSTEDWLLLGSTGRTDVDREAECVRADGTRVPVVVREALIPQVNGVEIVRFVADRSQLVRLEEELKQSRRMEGVGLLAGGVAHDFNNLLTVIAGYLDLMREPARGNPEVEQSIEQISSATEKASSLTRQLLAFGRQPIDGTESLDLSRKVHEFTSILNRMLGEHIELVLDLATDIPPVTIETTQADQILLNLVANARDAMPSGGRLTLRTRRFHVGHGEEGSHEMIAGEYATLEVADTGIGMDEPTLRRAFEPFFTTKSLGRGSGIGLASVRNIVDGLRGYVRVTSEVGVGTKVTIALPITTNTILSPTASERMKRATVTARTVLVVQDLPELRRLIVHALQRDGFEVLAAASASEGLELLARHGGRCDLMIADVLMPQMSGAELARCVRRHWSAIQTLFVSGYSEPELLAIRREDLSDMLLSKPFTLEQLRDRVRFAFDPPTRS